MNPETWKSLIEDIKVADSVDTLVFAEHQAGIYLASLAEAGVKLGPEPRRLITAVVEGRIAELV